MLYSEYPFRDEFRQIFKAIFSNVFTKYYILAACAYDILHIRGMKSFRIFWGENETSFNYTSGTHL